MSRTKIVLAGEGGQGVQSIAKILVEAGYEAGKQVLYIPNFRKHRLILNLTIRLYMIRQLI